MALFSAYLGLLGSPYLDPVRDIYWAHRIASFAEWPLVGPEIGFFTHLGPGWYYLLAPALWFDQSFASVAAWAGLLQGSQFVLALMLGRALGHWRFGLILALLLALPGLHTFIYQSFNHFNLVPSAALGLLLLALRDWRQPTPVSALALGLVFALMLHAHPATIALGWIAVLPWLAAPRRVIRGLMLGAGTLLPFLPLLVAAATGRLPETPTGGALAHLGTHFDLAALTAAPQLLWHILVGGTDHGLTLLTQGVPDTRPFLTTGLILLLGLALTGLPALLRQKARRFAALVLVLGIASQVSAALLMRSETLWYMMLAVPTFAFALLALSLAAIDRPALRPLVLPLTLVIGLGSLVTLLGTLLATNDDNGRRHFPAAFMMNLQAGAAAGVSNPGPQLSFSGSDRLGRALCSTPDALILHGAVAQQADTLTDLILSLHCPELETPPMIGGRAATDLPRWLAVGPRIAEAIDVPAAGQLESLHFYPIGQALHPARSEPLARARDYPPRPRAAPSNHTEVLNFTAACSEPVLVSNVYPWWAPVTVENVRANGEEIMAAAADSVSRLYRFEACRDDTPTQWEIRFRAPEAMPPDIVTIATSPGPTIALPPDIRQ